MAKEKTSQRKRLIIETAAELFIQKGFHQTSIRDIAMAAGISLGNIYNHFSGKNELISAIALLEAEENQVLERILEDHARPLKSYMKFMDSYIRTHAREADARLSAEVMAEALRNPDIGDPFMANNKNMTDKLARLLDAGHKQGVMQFEDHAAINAHVILDILESACISSFFHERRIRRQYLNRIRGTCLLLAGIK